MDAYKVIENWIKKGKTYISDNEISNYKDIKETIIKILRENYNAKYCPSNNPNFCGGYNFINPYTCCTKIYHLYCAFKGKSKTSNWRYITDSINYSSILTEILRIEFHDIYWNHKESIHEYVQKISEKIQNNTYNGKWHQWYIREENYWQLNSYTKFD